MSLKALAPLVLLVTGCSTTSVTPIQLGGINMVSNDAESQLLVIYTPEDREKMCLTPPPDAVATSSQGFAIGVPGETVAETSGHGAAVMGGRSPAVLISREVFYRACELAMNYKLSKDEALALFDKSLQHLSRLSGVDSGTAPLSASDKVPLIINNDNDENDD